LTALEREASLYLSGDTMKIRQINVVLENTAGQFFEMAEVLAKGDVDLRSVFVTTATEFSVVHVIVDKPDLALSLLRSNHYYVNEAEVFALKADDRPGGLLKILDILRRNNLNIEYVYGFGEKSDNQAVFVFRITEIDKAIEVLGTGALKYLTSDNVEGKRHGSDWEFIESL
jgi:hypothetical protein